MYMCECYLNRKCGSGIAQGKRVSVPGCRHGRPRPRRQRRIISDWTPTTKLSVVIYFRRYIPTLSSALVAAALVASSCGFKSKTSRSLSLSHSRTKYRVRKYARECYESYIIIAKYHVKSDASITEFQCYLDRLYILLTW